MALDPRDLVRRAGLSTEQATAAAVTDLQRPDPGVPVSGVQSPDVITVNGTAQGTLFTQASVDAQGSPAVVLRVPEPGAFVQFYGEVQARFTVLDPALAGADMSWLLMQVIDDLYLAADYANALQGARGNYRSMNSNTRLGLPSAWVAIRQPGVPADDFSAQTRGGQGFAGQGVLGVQWMPAGVRTIRLGCMLNGVAMGTSATSQAEFRNRRLMARVLG